MMSHEEHDKLNKIGADIDTIKRWWPVLVAFATIVIAAIEISSSATSTYDNKVAKKDDITELRVLMQQVSEQVKDVREDVKSLKTKQASDKTLDSNQMVAIHDDLANHITNANKRFKYLIDKFNSISAYTQQYSYDKNGKRILKFVPAQTAINN